MLKARNGLLKIPQGAMDVSKLPICRCFGLGIIELMSNHKSLLEAYECLLQVA
jgi:hypothetical protein